MGSDAYSYVYNAMGNITSITRGMRKNADPASMEFTEAGNSSSYKSYEYDAFQQLTRENNTVSDTTKTYTYDAIGNLTSVKNYDYTEDTLGTVNKTVNYAYGKDGKQGWNHLLTGVDMDGNGTLETEETISYDEIGNPTAYLGGELAWHGRKLRGYTKGTGNVTYDYGSDGMREVKTVNGERTEYYYANENLSYQRTYAIDGTLANELYFFYDSYNNLTAVFYFEDGVFYEYYVLTNQLGDVIGLYDEYGLMRASYEYDAWGNTVWINDTTGIGIASINPIRYRGYYYDAETGFYYLGSRYYNSEVGRFLNADGYVSTGVGLLGHNMFSYCNNNPVNMTDSDGNRPMRVPGIDEYGGGSGFGLLLSYLGGMGGDGSCLLSCDITGT